MPALACDYDGTLAHDGHVADETLQALERLRALKWQLILVTGRELPDLLQVFPAIPIFDLAVVENGALIYRPANGGRQVLAGPPPQAFVQALRDRGVHPLSTGRAIVATCHPH